MKTTLLVALLMLTGTVSAQDFIELRNPSFEEDEAGRSIVPSGWINLPAEETSTPDIQPGFWEVTLKPQSGHRYVGLVVRDDNTREGIGQKLEGKLELDSRYEFTVWLTRASSYKSRSPSRTDEPVSFDNPAVLEIWGHNSDTGSQELLAESGPVVSDSWGRYAIRMMPENDDYDVLYFIANYASGYQGSNCNILIDNFSDIVRIAK